MSRAPAEAQERLAHLRERLLTAEAGRLYPGAAHRIVFGEGDPCASLFIVGEGPGAEEDRQGRPFVGPSGALLDKILLGAGTPRAAVYITNIVKRRPPNNRDPLPDEIRVSLPFLHAQIAIVRPRVILTLGRIASGVLASNEFTDRTKTPISVLRKLPSLRYTNARTDVDLPIVATYHPSFVLRQLEYGTTDLETLTSDIHRALSEASESGVEGT